MVENPSQNGSSTEERETYTVGYGPNAQHWHMQRTASSRASFLLPHLRHGMTLLDCGCGPGSITVGLAEVVAPGLTVALDLSRGQIVKARSLADGEGLANLDHLAGDI